MISHRSALTTAWLLARTLREPKARWSARHPRYTGTNFRFNLQEPEQRVMRMLDDADEARLRALYWRGVLVQALRGYWSTAWDVDLERAEHVYGETIRGAAMRARMCVDNVRNLVREARAIAREHGLEWVVPRGAPTTPRFYSNTLGSTRRGATTEVDR